MLIYFHGNFITIDLLRGSALLTAIDLSQQYLGYIRRQLLGQWLVPFDECGALNLQRASDLRMLAGLCLLNGWLEHQRTKFVASIAKHGLHGGALGFGPRHLFHKSVDVVLRQARAVSLARRWFVCSRQDAPLVRWSLELGAKPAR